MSVAVARARNLLIAVIALIVRIASTAAIVLRDGAIDVSVRTTVGGAGVLILADAPGVAIFAITTAVCLMKVARYCATIVARVYARNGNLAILARPTIVALTTAIVLV